MTAITIGAGGADSKSITRRCMLMTLLLTSFTFAVASIALNLKFKQMTHKLEAKINAIQT